MTLFSQLNKNSINKLTTMNALALMVFVLLFLTSSLVHADHLIEQATQVEQSACYICHQGVDTPPKLLQPQAPLVASYIFVNNEKSIEPFKSGNFLQPQLRAPPIFQ